jgi:holin-like protein
MANTLLLILCCQFAGEVIVHFSGAAIPSPVIGMALLLTGLIIKGDLPDNLEKASSKFIQYIGLLFVPAGAGISMYLNLIAEQWLVVLAASFTGTVATLVLTAYSFKWLEKKQGE